MIYSLYKNNNDTKSSLQISSSVIAIIMGLLIVKLSFFPLLHVFYSYFSEFKIFSNVTDRNLLSRTKKVSKLKFSLLMLGS